MVALQIYQLIDAQIRILLTNLECRCLEWFVNTLDLTISHIVCQIKKP